VSDTDFRAEIEMFGSKTTRGVCMANSKSSAFPGISEARHDCARRGLAVNRRGRMTTER